MSVYIHVCVWGGGGGGDNKPFSMSVCAAASRSEVAATLSRS